MSKVTKSSASTWVSDEHNQTQIESTEPWPRDPVLHPLLDEKALATITRYGSVQKVAIGRVLVTQGHPTTTFVVVLEGAIAVDSKTGGGVERMHVHGKGSFVGDIQILTGRLSFYSVHALQPSKVVLLDRNATRRLLDCEAEMGELIMRALLQRRYNALKALRADVSVIGSKASADTTRIREFLFQNLHPHTFFDTDEGLSNLRLSPEERECVKPGVSTVVTNDLLVLDNPREDHLAMLLGLNPVISENALRDVVIVGAGPAGLSAATYVAAEGLSTLILDAKGPGGQAASSSRIENYLGFPFGISGRDLATHAYYQTQRFGADLLVARSARRLLAKGPYEVETTDGSSFRARALVIASGARYRRLPIANLERFEGCGVYYAATAVEAQVCSGEEIAIVGGGNSAGQAAVYLAKHASRVHLIVRGSDLCASMSRYLIQRIRQSSNIVLHLSAEVTALNGGERLEGLEWRNLQNGEVSLGAVRHLFSMTGAVPATAWLETALALDAQGFILTGSDLTDEHLSDWHWTLDRKPYPLETSLPGVFAVGDVRANSIKRVAAGVGEGSVSATFIHRVLES